MKKSGRYFCVGLHRKLQQGFLQVYGRTPLARFSKCPVLVSKYEKGMYIYVHYHNKI